MFSRAIFLAFALLCCIVGVFGQLSKLFCASEIEDIKHRARRAVSSASSTKDLYNAFRILTNLKDESGSCANCDLISRLVQTSSNTAGIFFGVSAYRFCGCGNITLSPTQRSTIEANLESTDLLKLAGSVKAAKFAGLELRANRTFELLRNLIGPDGMTRSSLNKKSPYSLTNTKIAVQLLSLLSNENLSKKALLDISDLVVQLLPQGDDEILVDPTLLSYIGLMISPRKPRVSESRLVTVVESLLSLRYSEDLEELADILESLSLAMTYTVFPVFVQLSKSFFNIDDAYKLIHVEVFNAIGSTIEGDLSVDWVLKDKKGKVVLELSSKSDEESARFKTIDLSGTRIETGIYTLDLSIRVSGRSKPVFVEKTIVVQNSVYLVKAEVAVVETGGKVADADYASTEDGEPLHDLSASAFDGDVVHVRFHISDPSVISSGGKGKTRRIKRPNQMFLRFVHVKSGLDVYFATSADLDFPTGNTYQATVSLGTEARSFQHRSGSYELWLIVADPLMSAPIHRHLAVMELAFPEKEREELPLYTRALLYDSDTTLQALPEIEHQMRPPAKRADSSTALVFTVLSLLPLLGYTLFVLRSNPNLALLKSKQSVLFLACLVAFACLFAGYWFALPLFSFYDTIRYLCFLAPVTVMFGRSSVAQLTTMRREQEAKMQAAAVKKAA